MHRARILILFCIAAAAGRAVLASSPNAVPARRAAPAARRLPDDRQIEAAIRARLAQSKISTDNFQVHVQGGVATIEGRTDVLQHKGVATRLAKSAGALQVVNRVEVSEAARRRASDNLAKGRRRAQIKRGQPRSER